MSSYLMPGKYSERQNAVFEKFCPRYAPDAKVPLQLHLLGSAALVGEPEAVIETEEREFRLIYHLATLLCLLAQGITENCAKIYAKKNYRTRSLSIDECCHCKI